MSVPCTYCTVEQLSRSSKRRLVYSHSLIYTDALTQSSVKYSQATSQCLAAVGVRGAARNCGVLMIVPLALQRYLCVVFKYLPLCTALP